MLNEIERNEIEALLEKKSQLATVKKVEINIKDEPKKLLKFTTLQTNGIQKHLRIEQFKLLIYQHLILKKKLH